MEKTIYGVVTNDVSGYVNLFVRITHIICNHHILRDPQSSVWPE